MPSDTRPSVVVTGLPADLAGEVMLHQVNPRERFGVFTDSTLLYHEVGPSFKLLVALEELDILGEWITQVRVFSDFYSGVYLVMLRWEGPETELLFLFPGGETLSNPDAKKTNWSWLKPWRTNKEYQETESVEQREIKQRYKDWVAVLTRSQPETGAVRLEAFRKAVSKEKTQ